MGYQGWAKQWGSHPKKNAKGGRRCRACGKQGMGGIIRKYGLMMCRQCFREQARDLGWTKYD